MDTTKQDALNQATTKTMSPLLVSNFWNDSVEQSFKLWLKANGYANGTVYNNGRAMKLLIRRFQALVSDAVEYANDWIDAERRFISFLNSNDDFITLNSAGHHMYSAALAAFGRYLSSGDGNGRIISKETYTQTGIIPEPSLFFSNDLTDAASTEQATDVTLPDGATVPKPLFHKKVDKTLLQTGFTVPNAANAAFCANLDTVVDRGSSRRIILVLNGCEYPATVFHVGFTNNPRTVIQVRYSANSPITKALRGVFRNSSSRFARETGDGSVSIQVERTAIEYADIFSLSPNVYSILCYPIVNHGEMQGTTSNDNAHTAKTNFHPLHAAVPVPPIPQYDPKIIERIIDVLSSYFANGFRIDSPIELVRFRERATSFFEEEIALPDEILKQHIKASGTQFDGKVYAVPDTALELIKLLVEEHFNEEASVIFYSAFYIKNEDWLFGANIVSEGMLITILRSLFPDLSFTKAFFGHADTPITTVVENEILRVWGDDLLLNYDQLAERLPFIPLERIKYVLGQNADFVWDSVGLFSHVSRIEISDADKAAVRMAAQRDCNLRGYASITGLPLTGIHELNPDLSTTAMHTAAFRICLSDTFDMKGKVIMHKGVRLDALAIMKEHCRTIERCTLSDLIAFERELTGEVHHWIPMEAGYAVLIRISKDLYVADKYVHFDVDAIDSAIEPYVKGDYLALTSFTTFAAFPDCGQTWNLFLLESYCRRFSQRFRFDVPSVNSRNAGAVIRHSTLMDYTEIMADAVAKAGVPLQDTSVGRFLYENGYIGKSTTAKAGEIIARAKTLRGE